MTPAQRRVLDALVEVTGDGWPATIEEVSAACGYASRSTPWEHMLQLERAGLVVRHPRNDRGGYMPAATPENAI